MTREEAIKGLTSLVEVRRKYVGMQTMKDEIECLEMATKALEQEPKSEWQHDHEILKAYSDGANEVLDKIRAEILHLHDWAFSREEVLKIIDKYKAGEE